MGHYLGMKYWRIVLANQPGDGTMGFSKEPILWIALVIAVGHFGAVYFHLSPELQAALDAVIGALGALFARSQVTPVA